ncbi:22635_t:CDS:2, partial [Cetraspora pellucida]
MVCYTPIISISHFSKSSFDSLESNHCNKNVACNSAKGKEICNSADGKDICNDAEDEVTCNSTNSKDACNDNNDKDSCNNSKGLSSEVVRSYNSISKKLAIFITMRAARTAK